MRPYVTLRATLAAVAALLVILLPARPAWAHAMLVKSDPAAGATVTAPLTAVTFTFNEMVKQQFSTVVVTGADGVSYSDGTPKSVDKTLTQPVKPLPPGAVKVVWRTVSGDGHPLEGQFTFTNAAPAPSSAAPSSAPPTSAAPAPPPSATTGAADPASSSDDGGSGLLWPASVAAAVVLVLVGGTLWWRRRAPGKG
ncbi:copper resistance protein CopC [Dactylosporangium aurantiacum]|uniref:Copper resistance protein CopC n=1 Tax=Dactylosporangium aurantiacum TaxID=35754 RepID=A0A9Q9IAD4_9ACTN|nr:copper resistance CopC family protein [Dactylosporangium aurantiacum]MDG6106997.1 copper resistance protein CopC [Dactylosporangium aurantiacum]UWZ50643.1 copper resistance protein CopC [Dactylosporangium aurantiacum]